jgi:HSP20 family molecular chaperone IbpA
MKVNDSVNLDDKMRNISKSKEMEIERVKNIYDKKIESAKTEGEDRYIASLKRNDEMVAGAGADYERKLKDYQENLTKTEKNISQAEAAFRTDHNEKMKSMKDQFSNNITDQYFQANDVQKSVEDQMKSTVQTIADKSRNEQKHLENESRSHINAIGNDYNHKIASDEQQYRIQFEAEKTAHEDQLRTQKTELKEMLDKNMQKGKELEAEKVQVQKQEISYLDNHQREMINQRTADFKIRYDNIVKEHEAILNNLKTHLDADMKKMVESTSAQKRMVASKNEDAFYRVETLNPAVLETEKDVSVSLKVPEHEKENVHLSVHGRDIKLTLSRKYTDSLESQDGSTNKSTRNELFSKEFTTNEILNPKLISQKYEKGTLTYKIQKA